MLKSMTAYGRGSAGMEGGEISIEVLSVNRRHLEVQVFAPRLLSSFEVEIRKRLSQEILRGQVTVRVSVRFHGKSPFEVQPNIGYAQQMKKGWLQIEEALEIPEGQGFRLGLLASLPDLFVTELDERNREELQNTVLKALDAALKAYQEMREKEASVLRVDFEKRLQILKTCLKTIQEQGLHASDKYRQKLLERLQAFMEASETDERILKEIALYADKIDITEEIVRFQSHVRQFEEGLDKADGKKLEFIVQEMQRETNTMGSKSMDVLITAQVINMKAELEKIREQLQNIE